MLKIFDVCNILEHADFVCTVPWLLWHKDFILKISKNLVCPADSY